MTMKTEDRRRCIRSVLEHQKGRCFYCHQELGEPDASLDHLVPRSAGGGDDKLNLVVCCRPLNHFLGNVSVAVKLRMLADSEFIQSLSRWCLVVDRNREVPVEKPEGC